MILKKWESLKRTFNCFLAKFKGMERQSGIGLAIIPPLPKLDLVTVSLIGFQSFGNTTRFQKGLPTMTMRKIIKKKWLNALRSKKFDQTEGSMCSYDGGAFCCLGVLKSITGQLREEHWHDGYPMSVTKGEALETTMPYAGLSVEMQEKLIHLNDEKKYSFEKIASYISRNVKVVD